jgi:hypothetical protein
VGEDPGVDHQQFVGRARFSAEHDPAEAHFGIDAKNELRQLCFTDPSIKSGTQLGDFRILLFGGERREVQLVIDAQRPGLRSGRDGSHPRRGALHEGLKKHGCIGREPQAAKIRATLSLPALLGNEQSLTATKSKAVVDPDGSIAKGTTQRQQRRYLERTECPFTVQTIEDLLPDATEEDLSADGQIALLVGVEIL